MEEQEKVYERETINERITETRKDKGLSQKKLCELADITASQLNRAETGKTGNISCHVIKKIAIALGVSTDYLLCLTEISTPKNYEIGKLKLSEGVVKSIVSGTVDMEILNRIIEHKHYLYLQQLINTYVYNTAVDGVRARNEIIDMVTSSLGDYIKAHPEQRKTIQTDIRHIKSEKLNEHEAELEKIKSTFLAILNNIKKDINADDPPREPATEAILQQAREYAKQIVKSPRKKQKAGDVAKVFAEMVKQVTSLDDKSAEMFEKLAEQVFTNN